MNQAFLSINEVSKQLGVPAHTLRYWEKQFPTAIKPATGTGGRRYYRPETISALHQIRGLLYDKGMTIAGVKKLIKEEGFIPTQGGIAERSDAVGGNGNDDFLPPTGAQTSAADSPQGGSGAHGHDRNNLELGRVIKLLELAKAELE